MCAHHHACYKRASCDVCSDDVRCFSAVHKGGTRKRASVARACVPMHETSPTRALHAISTAAVGHEDMVLELSLLQLSTLDA